MVTTDPKDAWVLAALSREPMDRIHLMKALFLPWYRSGRRLAGFFEFRPYLYGPYSAQVYDSLDRLQEGGLVAPMPAAMERWAKFSLTPMGLKDLATIERNLDPDIRAAVETTVDEVSSLPLGELLTKVYSEAPEFAVESVYAVAQRLAPQSQ